MPEQSLNYLHKWDARLKFAFPNSVSVLRYLNNGLEKWFSIYSITVFESLRSPNEQNSISSNRWKFVTGIPTIFFDFMM